MWSQGRTTKKMDPLGPSGECWRLHASSILTFSSSTLPAPLVEQFWDQIGARNLHYTLFGGQVEPFVGLKVEVTFCGLAAMERWGGPREGGRGRSPLPRPAMPGEGL